MQCCCEIVVHLRMLVKFELSYMLLVSTSLHSPPPPLPVITITPSGEAAVCARDHVCFYCPVLEGWCEGTLFFNLSGFSAPSECTGAGCTLCVVADVRLDSTTQPHVWACQDKYM